MPALLPRPRCALTAPFHPCRPCVQAPVGSLSEGLGGLLSVALSVSARRVELALPPDAAPQALPGTLIRRSPDFPPPRPDDGPKQRLPGRLPVNLNSRMCRRLQRGRSPGSRRARSRGSRTPLPRLRYRSDGRCEDVDTIWLNDSPTRCFASQFRIVRFSGIDRTGLCPSAEASHLQARHALEFLPSCIHACLSYKDMRARALKESDRDL